MASDFETGKTNAQQLVQRNQKSQESDRNEATTRLQLIDDLFFGCLGWEKDACQAEERIEGKFIDYTFYLFGRSSNR